VIDFLRHPGSRTFLWMWFGQTISTFGTSVTFFALGVYLYETTGQATPLAILGIARFLPQIALSPLAGVIVDRIDRKWAMLLSDVGQGLAVLAVLLLFAADHLQPWLIYLLFAFASLADSLRWTAEAATMTLLVPKEHLGRANGLQSFGEGLGGVTGPAIAGALLAVIGISHLLLIDVLAYALDVIILLFLTIPRVAPTQAKQQGNIWREMATGWHYIRARSGLLGLLLVTAVANLADISVAWRLVPALVLAATHRNTLVLGLVGSAFDLGMLAGGAVMAGWGGPRNRVLGLIGGSVLLALCGEVLFGLGRSLPIWLLAAFLGPFFIPIRMGSSHALWQAKVAPELQGRVFAVRRAISQITFPLGLLLVGPLADDIAIPAMRGPLGSALRPVFGSGPGRGYALTMVLLGLFTTLVYLLGALLPAIRTVQRDLPDAVAVPG